VTTDRRYNEQLGKRYTAFLFVFRLPSSLGEILKTKRENKEKKFVYFSGTYIEERDAPIPGVPCLTGLLVIANSPR
jgi:hypothetical protein